MMNEPSALVRRSDDTFNGRTKQHYYKLDQLCCVVVIVVVADKPQTGKINAVYVDMGNLYILVHIFDWFFL